MRVAWHKSIAFKLFLVITTLMTVAIAGLAYQNTSTLWDFLDRSLEDGSVARARDAATSTGAVFRRWIGIAELAARTADADLPRLVDAAPDVRALQIIQGRPLATTALAVAPRVGGAGRAALTRQSVAWVKGLKQDLAVDVAPGVAPGAAAGSAARIALRFVDAARRDGWVVLVVDTDELARALPRHRAVKAWIVGTGAARAARVFARTTTDEAPAAAAIPSRGFAGVSRAAGSTDLLSHAEVPGLDLMVVLARDATGARGAVMRNILRNVIWAWLILATAVTISFLAAQSVTRRLNSVIRATGRIAAGDFGARVAAGAGDEIGALGRSVNVMTTQIRDLLAAKVEAARVEAELETARLVQSSFYPQSRLASPTLTCISKCYPASRCGGDWWGHYRAKDGSELFFIADAVGHGASAALVTAMAYAAWRLVERQILAELPSTPRPTDLIEVLNQALYTPKRVWTTMTMFVATLDYERGVMRFASAGHPAPYLVPRAADDPRLKRPDDRILSLMARGDPLGFSATPRVVERSLRLAAGDRFVLYTDGLYECQDRRGDAWGARRLREAIKRDAALDAAALLEGVLGDAFGHFGERPIDDDVTTLVLEVAPTWRARRKEAVA